MQARLDGKLVLLYTLLVLQVLIVMIYVATTPQPELIVSTTRSSVSFVKFERSQVIHSGEKRLVRNPQLY